MRRPYIVAPMERFPLRRLSGPPNSAARMAFMDGSFLLGRLIAPDDLCKHR